MRPILRLTPTRVVAIALVGFIIYFSLAGWYRQVNLATSQFDMGNMDQTIWHTVHGQFFQMTEPGNPELRSRAAWHADFLLLIYSPFYALWPDPRTMLILQVLFVASGALPLYWWARKKIGDRPAAILSTLYLLYPALQHGLVFDVHAVTLVTPILLWAWWAAAERRWWVYYPMIVLAVLGKEEVGLTIAAIGFFWIWRRGYRLMGIVSLMLGLGTTMLMLGYVIPHFRGAPGHFAIETYAQFGDTPFKVVEGVVRHPIEALQRWMASESLGLYARLLAPVAGIALLGWPMLLALPELAVNIFSSNPNQHTILFQYMSVIIPFVFLGTVDGYCQLIRRRPQWSRRSIWVLGAAGVISVWAWAPLPGMRHQYAADVTFTPSPYRAAVQEIRRQLRPTDRVVATNNILPQFSQRDRIWGFPYHLEQADAIIVLEGGEFEFKPAGEISALVQTLQTDTRFTLVMHDRQLWYYRNVTRPH
jgi:uncharacterized membrane protein